MELETRNIKRCLTYSNHIPTSKEYSDAEKELAVLVEHAKKCEEDAERQFNSSERHHRNAVEQERRAERAESEVARLRAEIASQKTLFTALMKDYHELEEDVVRMRAEVSENVWKNPVRHDDGSVSLALTAYKAIKAVEAHEQDQVGKDGG